MNRTWAVLFALVPVGVMVFFLLAAWEVAPLRGLWLPPHENQLETRIDGLLRVQHMVAAAILALTGLLLAGIVWRGTRAGTFAALAVSGNGWLELLWTVIPAGILVWLAILQHGAWQASRAEAPQSGGKRLAPLVRAVSFRFGWEFHHAGPDGIVGTADDVIELNRLVVPADENVVLELVSRDVIHGFSVPRLRIRQDVVPGLRGEVWFRMRPGVSASILCTELCGWGHYLMQARLESVPREDYDRWLEQAASSGGGSGRP